MDWEHPFGSNSRVFGSETDGQENGTRIAAHLPSLQSMRDAPSRSIKTFPTWRAPELRRAIIQNSSEEDENDDLDDAKETSAARQVARSSRYLHEGDRRSILFRLDRGEKQSNLAREYKVTRAAICYLNKHRNEVLARTNTDPLAKHPKISRPAVKRVRIRASLTESPRLPSLAALLLSRTPHEASPTYEREPIEKHGPQFVHEIKTVSMALLLTKVENVSTSLAEFQRNINRMMHLLAEEALANVAVVPFDASSRQHEHDNGYNIVNQSCAISMMTAACPMLSILSQLEPELPSGYAYVRHVDQSSYATVELSSSSLPPTLKNHNTLIMDLVTGSGHQLCAVINKLLECGASMNLIIVVSLFASSDAIAMVHGQFPGVRFLAAQIDPPLKAKSAWPRSPSRGRQFWKWFAHLYEPRPFRAEHSQSAFN